MIKTTLKSLLLLVQSGALLAVLNEPRRNIGAKVGYHAGRLARAIDVHVGPLAIESDRLVQEYLPDGNQKKRAGFDAAWESILSTEVEIDLRPLTRAELESANGVSEAHLLMLEDAGILVDGEPPAPA